MNDIKSKTEYFVYNNTEVYVVSYFGFPKFIISHKGKLGDSFNTIEHNVDNILGQGAYAFFRNIPPGEYQFKNAESHETVIIPLEHYDTWKRQPQYKNRKPTVF